MIMRSRLVLTTVVGAVALVAIAGTSSQASPSPRHSPSANHHHAVGPAVHPALTSNGYSVAASHANPALRPTLSTNSGVALAGTARPLRHPTLTSNSAAGVASSARAVPTLTSNAAAYSSRVTLHLPAVAHRMSPAAMHMTTMCGGASV